MEHVLKTTGLTKKYDRKAVVNNISMTIAPGDVYGFIGRNGAGKTTFMRVVLGMALPDAGEISFFDGEPRRIAGQKIGSIIEAPALFGGCTALENLKRFSLLISGDVPDNLGELIELVGLSDAGKKLVGHYSLGMKQRLGLAVAMLGNPQFMVLDEPVNGLDPAGIKDMRDTINVLNREKGVTFLISSHLLDELSRTVTKYGIINDGVLVEEISATELADKCRQSIAITVDDTAKAFAVLKDVIPADDIRIAGMEMNVYNHTAEASALNALLVRNGIAVSSLGSAGYSIENYFIERMGG
ncbi:MAG: ATP-binding cassette domain-containing protein [Lachnospiraceae bacterium]|nr:ATP-binding cassette domain-containing protein [Lachnospiraceae bacterium]